VAFVERLLSSEARERAEAHMDDCAECRRLVSELARSDAAPRTSESRTTPLIARGTTVGRYLVLEPLGLGGMSVVYLAYDPELDRRVALKLLRSDRIAATALRSRLQQEAKALARLSHPNVTAVYDVGSYEDQLFCAIEFIDGMTIRQWLAERRRSWTEIVDVFLEAGRGLAAAHAMGLVHRDFKPENVLYGRDGRVRVTDFGLARLVSSPEEALPVLPTEGAPAETRMTRAGTVAGTPGYLAPEQYEGKDADARSDQFCFCVALYEALYGTHPFGDVASTELADRVIAGRIEAIPHNQRVPARIRRLLVRGLSPAPNDRYASLDALLVQLARARTSSRRRIVALAAGIAIVTTAALLYRAQSPKQLCGGAEQQLTGIWDAPRKQIIHAAFTKTNRSFSEDAWARIESTLDSHARAWIDGYGAACEATRVHGVQSEAVLDRRMKCLDQRLRELRALTDVYEHADADVVEQAVYAAGTLGRIDACADLQLLSAQVQPPSRPETRKAVEAVRGRLAEANMLLAAGKVSDATQRAQHAAADAHALGYEPLEAEALYARGTIEGYSRADLGERYLKDALVAAEASAHDEIAERAATDLVAAVGVGLQRYAEGHEWARHAEALLRRRGDDPLRRAMLATQVARLYRAERQYARSIEEDEKALPQLERSLGNSSVVVAETHRQLSLACTQSGDADGAIRHAEQALAIWRRAVGSAHPSVAEGLRALGNAQLLERRFDDAIRAFEEARQISQVSLGADSVNVGVAFENLAEAYNDKKDFDRGEQEARTALAIFERKLDANHVYIAETLITLGRALQGRGKEHEAQQTCERAYQRMTAAPSDRPTGEDALTCIAIAVERSNPQSALASFQRALAIREQSVGTNDASLVADLLGMGRVYLRLGQSARAADVLERATKLVATRDDDDAREARTLLAQARDQLAASHSRH